MALRAADVEKWNLVHVSSILPPRGTIISRSQRLKELLPGQLTYAVVSRLSSNEPRGLLASLVGCAIPAGRKLYG